jgi:hypothetical protein
MDGFDYDIVAGFLEDESTIQMAQFELEQSK